MILSSSRSAPDRHLSAFQVRPLGDRWAVVSRDEVLAVTETEQEAADLAISAAGALRLRLAQDAPVIGEGRSFSDW